MLMMLALFWGFGKNPLQLMLMMLALFCGGLGKAIAADAHDASLVLGGFGEKPIAADVRDAVPVSQGLGKTYCS